MVLHYRKTGQGMPLIILHGLYGSADNWMSIARRLSERCEIIVPDMRNHGHSPHHPVHTYPEMCADVVELMDALHLEKCALMGHSMGGKTAIHIAATVPQRISRMIVADIAPVNYASLTEYSPAALEHLNLLHVLLNTDLSLFSKREDIEQYWTADIPDAATRRFLLKNLQRSDNSFIWRLHLQAIARNLPHILNGFDEERFRNMQLPMPALFLKGGKSPYLQPEMTPAIQQLFPQAQIAVIPDAGHWLHAEQPKLFVQAVEKFMS
ncbi:MAG: alpha/beta fold hydrolase [Bacteroidales bacterium]|jgi:pimeloyl-ACP methyl ester carboxylesterase|nr:alpha/beta fold hydrolase [Bacteroidales bacterium]